MCYKQAKANIAIFKNKMLITHTGQPQKGKQKSFRGYKVPPEHFNFKYKVNSSFDKKFRTCIVYSMKHKYHCRY